MNTKSNDGASNGGWTLHQSFGDRTGRKETVEADILSAVEFDPSGKYLAIGDKGGRVMVFNRNSLHKPSGRLHQHSQSYTFHTEFQSHEAEFDYLKSLEIEEKINQIKWARSSNNSLFLLSTNDKTIKLWKIYDKKVQVLSDNNKDTLNGSTDISHASALRLPTVNVAETVIAASPKRVYSNAHAYHINSIALNSDGETYLSADDLRINLWSLGINSQSFNIVDIKPKNMEELTEVITAADFHPTQCNLMMYSSSRGAIKLGDLRAAALCNEYAKVYEEPEDPASKSFFSEIIASISDVKFSPDGRYIYARDYLTLKIWDLHMESKPIQTIPIHDHLKPRLCDLYENDCIFDKFECAVSANGHKMITGSYNNMFHIYDVKNNTSTCLEASSHKFQPGRRHSMPHTALQSSINHNNQQSISTTDTIDFRQKVLHTTWHPEENEVAVATGNNLYIYNSPEIDQGSDGHHDHNNMNDH